MSNTALTAPSRTSMCTVCRVLLDRDESCDVSARHAVVPLDTAAGREALCDEVWSAPRLHLFVTPESRLIASVVLVGAFVGIAVMSSPIVALILVLFPFLLLPAAFVGMRALTSLRRRKKLPRGSPSHVLLPPISRRRMLVGQLVATTSMSAPLSGQRCVGYGLHLRCEQYMGGDVVLADGAITACDVQLDDGRTVHIPAGRIRLESSSLVRIADQDAIRRYLTVIDDALNAPAGPDPVPYDHAWEGLLHNGARVAVFGKTTEVPLSYRESGTQLRLTHAPRVRVLES